MRGRPKKPRKIQKEPYIKHFSPRGHIGRPGYTDLAVDQYEALRLSDFLGISQKEAAASMEVSQQTYSRVLKSARKAISEGLVLGRMIRIRGPEKPRKDAKKGQKPLKNPA
ncbi:MAG: DUF134 domain-containing protein [Candidatus Omnitrophica bacterium]|nr:DUF134 domain-containing protein [Candidatus Omnitrophota bacterium]